MSFWFNKIKGLWHRVIEEDILCLSQAFPGSHVGTCTHTCVQHTHTPPAHMRPNYFMAILFYDGKVQRSWERS